MTKVNESCILCNSSKKIHAENQPSFNTLAQLAANDENEALTFNENTSISDRRTLLKRAKRKYLSHALILRLVDVSKHNEKSILTKSYWNAFHCAATLSLKSDGSVTGKYCNTRWCTVCGAIRTAKHINHYKPIVDDWEDPHFVTLTEKNCTADQLSDRITAMCKIFQRILKYNTDLKRRGKEYLEILGIRKIECTYNHKEDTYHPHFHVICNSKRSAEYLYNSWLQRNSSLTNKLGQDIRKVTPGSMVELFKYMAKVITDVDGKKVIHAKSLDVIYNAMHKRRTIQPFGFRAKKITALDDADTLSLDHVINIFNWEHSIADWVGLDGECLSNHKLSESLKEICDTEIKPNQITEIRSNNTITRRSRISDDKNIPF